MTTSPLPGRPKEGSIAHGGKARGAEEPADRVAVPLRRLAHGRTGDKGDRCSISVIAFQDQLWPLLVEQVSEPAVAGQFAFRRPVRVVRYLLPRLCAMNFVIDGVLDGGVNNALNLDSHGKSLSFLLLDMQVQVPSSLLPLLAGDEETWIPPPFHSRGDATP